MGTLNGGLAGNGGGGSGGGGGGVSSFNTRTGAVSLSKSDVTGTGLIWSDVTAAEQLQAVAVKSSAYAAASGNFVPCDLSGGIFTVTLPLTPAEGTRIGFKIVKQAAVPNTLTIATGGGSDVFNIAGGSTTLTLAANRAGCLLQYTAATGIWYVTAMETPLNAASGAAQLGTDGTVFGPGGSAIVSSVALPGAPTAATAPALTNNAQIATTAYADTADVTSQYQAVISTYLFR